MNVTVWKEPQKLASTHSSRHADYQTSDGLSETYQKIRAFSLELCKPLEAEDYVIQTMPEASPTKWHLAHTSWFFETFVLQPRLASYRPFHPPFGLLFH